MAEKFDRGLDSFRVKCLPDDLQVVFAHFPIPLVNAISNLAMKMDNLEAKGQAQSMLDEYLEKFISQTEIFLEQNKIHDIVIDRMPLVDFNPESEKLLILQLLKGKIVAGKIVAETLGLKVPERIQKILG